MKKLTEKIIAFALSGVLLLSTWTLKTVVDLKVQVAELKTEMAVLSATNNKHIAVIP